MKFILSFLIVLLSKDASALEIQVNKMTRSMGYQDRYVLHSSFPEKLTLDCQSFVQGIFFGEVFDDIILLQEWECDELLNEMKKSLRRHKNHCIEFDLNRGIMERQRQC
jgi:hypothetical protein